MRYEREQSACRSSSFPGCKSRTFAIYCAQSRISLTNAASSFRSAMQKTANCDFALGAHCAKSHNFGEAWVWESGQSSLGNPRKVSQLKCFWLPVEWRPFEVLILLTILPISESPVPSAHIIGNEG